MPPMMPPMGPMPPMMPPLGPMMPPMAGPGPSGMPPLSGGLPGQAPGGGGGKPEPTTFIDRVRAICGMLNIGNAARMLEEKPGARTAAVQAVRSGAAFRENPFADDVEGYLQAA